MRFHLSLAHKSGHLTVFTLSLLYLALSLFLPFRLFPHSTSLERQMVSWNLSPVPQCDRRFHFSIWPEPLSARIVIELHFRLRSDRRMKNLSYFTLCAACGWSVENRVHLTPPDSITQKAGGNQAAGKWLLNKFPPPTAGRGHHWATKGRRCIIYCISHRVHFFVPPERQNSICNFNKCEIRHSFLRFCAAWMKNGQNARRIHWKNCLLLTRKCSSF
jgi:hypothetical protein